MTYYVTFAESYYEDEMPEEFCEACKMYIYDGECDC